MRLSEKVFSLLVVVYGSKFKQSYDQNRRPLPAVAWDGEEAGRLIFETKWRTPDEGNPRISVVEHYPDGVKPPPVAERGKPEPKVAAETAPPSTAEAGGAAPGGSLSVDGESMVPPAPSAQPLDMALTSPVDQPPPPLSAPVGVVEEIRPEMADTSGAVDVGTAMATLSRELAHAKGKAPPVAAQPSPSPDVGPEQPVAGPQQAPSGSNVAAAASAGPAPVVTSAAPSPKEPGVIAVDIAPPPATGSASSAPAVSVVDPGPVTLPAPTKPVETQTTGGGDSARVSTPPAALAPESTSAVPVTPAAVKPDRRLAIADVPPPSRGAPDKGTAIAPVGPTLPPSPFRQTAALPPLIKPPSYAEPGALPEPTDLDAPEALTVPEDEANFREREAAVAAAVTGEGAPPRQSLEAEVQRRLGEAPMASPGTTASADAQPGASTPGNASEAPLSLLSAGKGEPVPGAAAGPAGETLARAGRHTDPVGIGHLSRMLTRH